MNLGVVLCFLGALSFGLSACISKIANRQKCNPSALVVCIFAWASAFTLIRTLSIGGGFHLPYKAGALAGILGVCAAVAILAFQTSIAIGQVTVAWLVMNLSAGVPAVVSIWVYREPFTPLKCVAFGVALLALVCLFLGKRQESRESEAAIAGEGAKA